MNTQTAIDIARIGRDAGMNLVAEHAGTEWHENAYLALINFTKTNFSFMTEDVRAHTEVTGMAQPHDNRAWGAVIKRAVKAAIIKRAGYLPSKTGHMRPMPLWHVCG